MTTPKRQNMAHAIRNGSKKSFQSNARKRLNFFAIGFCVAGLRLRGPDCFSVICLFS
jgi:hypothetical protein